MSTPWYRHARVADLAWVINSPSMVLQPETCSAFYPADSKQTEAWLSALDENPDPLSAYLGQHAESHFLGAIFENLWCFYLDWHPRYECVARNLQVIDEGRTLGEFDVLVFDRHSRRFIHQELAVKFYLGVQDRTLAEASRWVGPNRNDRLERKYRSMCERQLRLSENPAAIAKLGDYGIQSVDRQCIFKGYLFQPVAFQPDSLQQPSLQRITPPLAYPYYVNEGCEQGGWLSCRHFLDFLQRFIGSTNDAHTRWLVLGKAEWFCRKHFAPASASLLDSQSLYDELLSRNPKRCVMVVRLAGNAENLYEESERFMLTPSGWESGEV